MQLDTMIQYLDKNNATLFPTKDSKMVLYSLQTANTNVMQIQKIFTESIDIFQSFLSVVLYGLSAAKIIDSQSAFIEPKTIVNEFIGKLTQLINTTADISQYLEDVDNEIVIVHEYSCEYLFLKFIITTDNNFFN